ncbi:MAG: nitronate monooxygenase family protein [Pseudomonadota bacterium]
MAPRLPSTLPPVLRRLRLPMIAAPMFIVSVPELVIAQCKAGVIGSFPALNARDDEEDLSAGNTMLDRWLTDITEALDRHNQANPDRPAAPFAVNQIVHRTNARLMRDIEICERWKVPIWITSLGARPEVNEAAHACGGIALHDVINVTYARKAIEKGADGLIAVAAGAGGHAGRQNPFALVEEIREWFDGPLLLSGAIATGRALLAAQVMGADLGYVGSPFIATREANADGAYKEMIVSGSADDIVTTSYFTGVSGNYLRGSITRAGLDPGDLEERKKAIDFAGGSSKAKAWRDIWGSGQGIAAVKSVASVEDLVGRLEREYRQASALFQPVAAQ